MNQSKLLGRPVKHSTDAVVMQIVKPLLQPKNQEKPLECRFCRSTFTDRTSLIVHERIHTDQRPYVCRFCSRSFRQSCNLRVHLRIHTGEKPFKCHICHHEFNQNSNLKTHLKTHSQDHLFWKSISGPEFTKLKQPESNHVDVGKKDEKNSTVSKGGKNPWTCLYCKAIFQQRSKLEEHERIHTGEKPFHCPFCDHRSSQKVNLNKHLMIHTGEKPYKCTDCSFRATQRSHLEVHQRVHLKKKILEQVSKLSAPHDFLHRLCDGVFHP